MSNEKQGKKSINLRSAMNIVIKDCTNNIFKLLILYIFLVTSITMVSYNVELGTYNSENEYERALGQTENKQFTFANEYDENGEAIGEYVNLDLIEEFWSIDNSAVLGFQTERYLFPSFDDEYNDMYGEDADEALFSYLYRPIVAVIFLDEIPCNILAGNIGVNNYNGLLIPDFLADFIINSGLFNDDLLEYSDLVDKYLHEITDAYSSSYTTSNQIIGIYETGMSEMLRETKNTSRDANDTLRILDQYTIYQETSYGVGSSSGKAVFIDGSEDLALDILQSYEISRNILFETIDNVSSKDLKFGIFTIVFSILAVTSSIIYFIGTIKYKNNDSSKSEFSLLANTKIYLLEIFLISIFIFIGSVIVINLVFFIVNAILSWYTGVSYSVMHLKIFDYALIFILPVIINLLGAILPVTYVIKE